MLVVRWGGDGGAGGGYIAVLGDGRSVGCSSLHDTPQTSRTSFEMRPDQASSGYDGRAAAQTAGDSWALGANVPSDCIPTDVRACVRSQRQSMSEDARLSVSSFQKGASCGARNKYQHLGG